MIGDQIHQALGTIGVTPDKVSRWLGRPCNCYEYRMRLNHLDGIARRILSGRIEEGRTYLRRLLRER